MFVPSSSLSLNLGYTLALRQLSFPTAFSKDPSPLLQPVCFPHTPCSCYPAYSTLLGFRSEVECDKVPNTRGTGRGVPALATALLTAGTPLGGDILKLHVVHALRHTSTRQATK